MRSKGRASGPLPFLLPVVFLVAGAAAGDIFQVRYEGDVPPAEADPPWEVEGRAEVDVADGLLHVDTGMPETFSITRHWSAEPEKGTYVRLRMRLASYTGEPTLAGAALRVADGTHEIIVIFSPGHVYVFGTDMARAIDTTDRAHDYRLSTRGTDFRFEVDGDLLFDGTGRFTQSYGGKNLVQFGDQSGQAGAEFYIDSFSYALGRFRNAPPSFSLLAQDRYELREGERIEVELGASDPDGDEISYRARELPPGASLDAGAGKLSWQVPFDAAGEHEIEIVATDGEYEASRTIRIAVANVNRAPRILHPRKTEAIYEAGSSIALYLSAEDEDGGDLACRAEGLPDGSSFEEGRRIFKWTPSKDQVGSHAVTFIASDGELETRLRYTIVVVPGGE
ncbi:MAG: hypothetical protein HY720_18915 [Planctomycetes bacterium]|nr:hypothetical protein [Planctomycetota bacterium]